MIRVKHIITLLFTFVLGILFACTGQNDSKIAELTNTGISADIAEAQSYINFDTTVHDFGTLIEGEQVVYYFDYVNNGEGNLIINSVKSSCGCTVPDWSKKPLGPGMKGSIIVKFDTSGREGEQKKVVTINSNAENSEVRLHLEANIIRDR